MKNGQKINQAERCPVHQTQMRKQYEFGKARDATVTVYAGCKCATCTVHQDLETEILYYDNYKAAAGMASFVKEIHEARGYA